MKTKNILSTVALLGLLFPSVSFNSPAMAQSLRTLLPSSSHLARVGFVPPRENGSPSNTRSAASRYLCQGAAIVPEDGLVLTTKEQPSLYMYVNEGFAEKAMLVVESSAGEEYTEVVSFSKEGGVVTFDMPAETPTLQVGEQYNWTFILMCDGTIRPDSPVMRGEIKRVAPVLTPDQAESMPLARQAEVYAEAGIWEDMLSAMVMIRAANPADSTAWVQTLQSVGFEENIAKAPLLAR